VKDLHSRKLIDLHHVKSEENVADGLTKKLSGYNFATFFYGLGLVDE
jgi:hypothetical protein